MIQSKSQNVAIVGYLFTAIVGFLGWGFDLLPNVTAWWPSITCFSLAGVTFASTTVYLIYLLKFKGRQVVSLDKEIEGTVAKLEEKRQIKTEREIWLNELENTLSEFRQSSEKLLENASKYTHKSYKRYLKDDTLFKQYETENEHEAIAIALMGRQMNPVLYELQENDIDWKEQKTNLIKLCTSINDGILISKIESYTQIYPKRNNMKLLAGLSEKLSISYGFKERREVQQVSTKIDTELTRIYWDSIKRINTLRCRERISKWLKIR
ncbi:MAG: hypothetical protein JRJ45_14225 [Deltaproteobacteria bacterium]|nr:hypothetical protein [Deltaproteobacteria bacterium]